jgi:DNA-binding MarR family transcriptional regulator
MKRQLTDTDYQNLHEFRTRLRRFLRWSEDQARAQDLTAAQHQLLLAIKGHPDPAGPSIGDVAGYLLLQHHSAVGLVDRAEAKGLVTRTPDPEHRTTVRLTLTQDGARRLQALSAQHLEEGAGLPEGRRPPDLQVIYMRMPRRSR